MDTMDTAEFAHNFVTECEVYRRELTKELRLYEPYGVMRLWRGRSEEHLTDVTNDRITAIRRELARLDATVELVRTLGDAL